jgi:NADH dehydrogenase
MKPRIVILGAGFGGVYVAKKLARLVQRRKVEVTIVNRTNYFLFTPLLHEVATGGLGPRVVAEALREVFVRTGVKIVQGDVLSIDSAGHTVSVVDETEHATLPYDYLVIATGAETNYYNIPGADTLTLPLKTLADAVRIRSRIIDAFELAMLEPRQDMRKKLLSFAIVGGGATGVEVAAELSEFVNDMVKRYYNDTDCEAGIAGHCSPEEPAISIVHTGKELLEMFAPSLRLAAARRLERGGVNLHLNSTVKSVTALGLELADGSKIPAQTIIWAAGVKAVIPKFIGEAPALSGGRLIVDQSFRLQGHNDIFAIGDAAAYVDADEFEKDSKNTRPVPMLAQVAVAQSKVVAYNIVASIEKKPLKDFHYHSKGSMVSVGQWFAIGEIYSMAIAGRVTWWIWRTVYLFKFASWQKRVRIAIEWTLDFFFPRDITKLM